MSMPAGNDPVCIPMERVRATALEALAPAMRKVMRPLGGAEALRKQFGTTYSHPQCHNK